MNNSIAQFSSYQLNPSDPGLKDLYCKLIIWMMFIRDATSGRFIISNSSYF
jgi:hypothetical protein